MSPFLEGNTLLDSLEGVKYVTFKGSIYYSDAIGETNIREEEHADLAERAGADTYDGMKRPIVDDGGHIIVKNGKIKFWDITGSCKTNDSTRAKEITVSIAKKILGEDKVV